MLSIEKLDKFGANSKEGLERCLNREDFYFKLIDKAVSDNSYINLKAEIENKNYSEAFKIAHSLKGVLGNLSLTPLYDIAYKLTEHLRNTDDIDYSSLINELLNKRNELLNLINN